jgi:quercetin dioxygenase-like cupin family protein
MSRERLIILSDPASRDDRSLVAHLRIDPGGRVIAPHIHPHATERFHVIKGRVGFAIEGRQRILSPGEQTEIPKGIRHDWWQVGDEPAEVVVDMQPGDRFIDMLVTLFGLVREGKVNRRGLPHLLQLAVVAQTYRDAAVLASPPPWAQRLVFGMLAPIGRLLGRQARYERHRTVAEITALDLDALALLDQHGRLRWD